jgi:hypothetical protein
MPLATLSDLRAPRRWAGIFFAPYSVMFPLYNLAQHPGNRAPLIQCGLIELVVRLMHEWRQGRQADTTLALALGVAEALSGEWDSKQRMRHAGMVAALQDIRAGRRGEAESCRAAADRLLLTLLEGHLAFWMGQHSRLGAGSHAGLLDDYVAGIILEFAFGARICRVGDEHAAAVEAAAACHKCNCG